MVVENTILKRLKLLDTCPNRNVVQLIYVEDKHNPLAYTFVNLFGNISKFEGLICGKSK